MLYNRHEQIASILFNFYTGCFAFLLGCLTSLTVSSMLQGYIVDAKFQQFCRDELHSRPLSQKRQRVGPNAATAADSVTGDATQQSTEDLERLAGSRASRFFAFIFSTSSLLYTTSRQCACSHMQHAHTNTCKCERIQSVTA